MKNKVNSVIVICLFAFIAMACNASFTTAKIDSFTFGKDETAKPPTTTFNVGDKVFAVANVTGAVGKYKLKWKITPSSGSPVEKEIEFEGSRSINYSFTSTGPGEYKFDVSLLDETGKEIDKKSGTVSVKGAVPTTSSDKPKSNSDDSDQDSDKDDKSPQN